MLSAKWARSVTVLVFALLSGAAFGAPESITAQSGDWVAPRTPSGHPDLQGNWSNATMTPIERPDGVGRVLTAAQVAALESGRADLIENALQPSDPDREAPAVGGEFTGNPLADAASGGTGGYNYFFIDAGDKVAVFNGEARSSLITRPESGRRPAFSESGRERMSARVAFARQFGEYDNPENRPLGERCLMSFGSNGGPPMTPNYFYNNNYTIVQTPDHVMILTEMVHDVRVIRMGEPRRLPEHVRPWMGDSWGHWEGDTLVVVTTNIHPSQPLFQISGAEFYPSEKIEVTERFTRASETTVNYEFTVDDPIMFDEPFGGEIPFEALDGLLYEYGCHEGNYALENVLRGARAQERTPSGGPSGRR